MRVKSITAVPVLTLVFTLASFIFNIIAFIAPTGTLYFGLANITPYKSNGPKIWMGLLGSCAQPSGSASVTCTSPSIPPKYDFSVISDPDNGKHFQVAISSGAAAAFVATSLILSFLFCASNSVSAFRRRRSPTSRRVKFVIMSLGIASLITGPLVTVFLRVMFGQAKRSFNLDHKGQDTRVKASIGEAFYVAAAGYSLLGLGVLLLIMDYNWYDKPKKPKVDEEEAKPPN